MDKKLFKTHLFTRRQAIQRMLSSFAITSFGINSIGSDKFFGNITSGESTTDQKLSLKMDKNNSVAYGESTLPSGIRSRFINNINGLTMHILEAGFGDNNRPCILLLHGFPELAYSWRKQMLPLADAGFHVIAPDQRGYGRTTGWDGNYDGDLGSFRLFNLVKDMLSLIFALGIRTVAAVVGHDFGSPVAAYCSLIRPDVFRSVVLMSAPFAGPPQLPFNTSNGVAQPAVSNRPDINTELAALPHPRKHYQRYYTTREANDNMLKCQQGIHNFLRAYYHFKSSDWKQNQPFPLREWSAAELSKLPKYYIMDLNEGMAETVAREMPTANEIDACKWLTDEELNVYSDEYSRNGFQGGLQWYRASADSGLQVFSGRTIDVPSCFIAGASDWGVYQSPGSFEKMKTTACTHMSGTHLIKDAGHWVQQEQPEETNKILLGFLQQVRQNSEPD
jgi:pimeloyl-ACP methyl ester carboxylesterase